jgi:hypothetical protein
VVARRASGVVLYALMAAVAVRPELSTDLRLGLAPGEVEAIPLTLVLLVGAHLAWLGSRSRPTRPAPDTTSGTGIRQLPPCRADARGGTLA